MSPISFFYIDCCFSFLHYLQDLVGGSLGSLLCMEHLVSQDHMASRAYNVDLPPQVKAGNILEFQIEEQKYAVEVLEGGGSMLRLALLSVTIPAGAQEGSGLHLRWACEDYEVAVPQGFHEGMEYRWVLPIPF